ncbi:unnamed protein product [Brachionus calyciflorus]|uniref:Integrase catalytic domain-containing protein n=1 Tax=Brachionus calyciflorus TaxID=104777 RepID=A0A813PEG9_9BILA|nr:unnamed protein product [Brachionus calyciflorus]
MKDLINEDSLESETLCAFCSKSLANLYDNQIKTHFSNCKSRKLFESFLKSKESDSTNTIELSNSINCQFCNIQLNEFKAENAQRIHLKMCRIKNELTKSRDQILMAQNSIKKFLSLTQKCIFCRRPMQKLNYFNRKEHLMNCKIGQCLKKEIPIVEKRTKTKSTLTCKYCDKSLRLLNTFNQKLHIRKCKIKFQKLNNFNCETEDSDLEHQEKSSEIKDDTEKNIDYIILDSDDENEQEKNSTINGLPYLKNLEIFEMIKKCQKEDQECLNLIKISRSSKPGYFSFRNGALMRKTKANKYKIVVPKNLRPLIIERYHKPLKSMSHISKAMTHLELKKKYNWKNSYQDICNYINSCECSKLPDPFEVVAIDILELSRTFTGNKFVVAFTDLKTEWTELFPIKDMSIETIAHLFVNEIIFRYSVPCALKSNQGKSFLLELIQLVRMYFINRKLYTFFFNPKTDKSNSEFNKDLYKMIVDNAESDKLNWDLNLNSILFAFRTSRKNDKTNSPFELLLGVTPRLPIL